MRNAVCVKNRTFADVLLPVRHAVRQPEQQQLACVSLSVLNCSCCALGGVLALPPAKPSRRHGVCELCLTRPYFSALPDLPQSAAAEPAAR